MKILRDDATFSDSKSARTRSVNELAHRYGVKAIPVIMEVIESIPYNGNDGIGYGNNDGAAFRAFCQSVVNKIVEKNKQYGAI